MGTARMHEERGRTVGGRDLGGPAEHHSWARRLRSWPRGRSVAGQTFLWLLAAVVLLVVAALAALVLQAQHYSKSDAEHRTAAAAIAVSQSPGMVQALESAHPSAILQPRAEQTRKSAGLDYVVIYNSRGIRYTHPNPQLIGKHVLGPYEYARKGPSTVTIATPLGLTVDTTAPIKRPDGSVAGFVSAGITAEHVTGVVNRQLPVLLGGTAVALALGMAGATLARRRLRRQTHGLGPSEMTRMYEHHHAVLHAAREGVLIVGGDGRLILANDEARRLLDLPPEPEGRPVQDLGLDPKLAGLLASGRVVTDEVHLAGDRLLAVNNRPTEPYGGQPGSVATLRDTTELRRLAGQAELARSRLQLLYDAGMRVGTTLNVVRTAQELADVAVPRFADFATVELADPVLRGDEPPLGTGTVRGLQIRRTAASGIRDDHPLYPVGSTMSFASATPEGLSLDTGRAVLAADLSQAHAWRSRDPESSDAILSYGIHSLISAPLQARGLVLGMVNFWRFGDSEPFGDDDVSFADELVARAAIAVDNARRFTREHTMAETLQRSLLPRGVPEQSALDLAYRYRPAHRGVGGDWFDVIPLPGFRVALVVGDVVGHGLHAAATMGRLRTAVHNFSTLDLPPDELIAHVDELVARIDQDEAAMEGEEGDGGRITGATCLYAIYDPVSGRCTMARAGHPFPALVRPDGGVEFVDLPAGPPLGVGTLPFETAKLRLEAGSRLVLYTDGLIENRHRDLEDGLTRLHSCLSRARTNGSPEEICTAVFDAMVQPNPSDDVALLVARTHLFAPDQVATWDVPHDPAAVSRVRSACVGQLTAWGLESFSFTTELILSELITNAVRYGTEPIHVRLLRDRTLVCEVSDGSSTAPHLRYAASTDEGGRGLYLVAQLAERWGTRYTERGKVIWTEQALTTTPGLFDAMPF
ncbi:SpoIIE family protein phosphatase [Streptomyces sp. NPDC057582]|uniref:SpoIIE family protein phosphatase n=1 Tax=Streptomyces sp. NPDC057582 TaxID=3346174 RepID=UPI00368B7378